MKMELRGGTDGKAAAGDADVPDRDGSAMGEGITSGMIIPDELKAAVLTLNNLALKLRNAAKTAKPAAK